MKKVSITCSLLAEKTLPDKLVRERASIMSHVVYMYVCFQAFSFEGHTTNCLTNRFKISQYTDDTSLKGCLECLSNFKYVSGLFNIDKTEVI